MFLCNYTKNDCIQICCLHGNVYFMDAGKLWIISLHFPVQGAAGGAATAELDDRLWREGLIVTCMMYEDTGGIGINTGYIILF